VVSLQTSVDSELFLHLISHSKRRSQLDQIFDAASQAPPQHSTRYGSFRAFPATLARAESVLILHFFKQVAFMKLFGAIPTSCRTR